MRGNVDENIDRAAERRNQGAGGLWARPPVLTPVPFEGVPQPRDKKTKSTVVSLGDEPAESQQQQQTLEGGRKPAPTKRDHRFPNEKRSKMSKVRDSSKRPKRTANQARRGALQYSKPEGKNIDL